MQILYSCFRADFWIEFLKKQTLDWWFVCWSGSIRHKDYLETKSGKLGGQTWYATYRSSAHGNICWHCAAVNFESSKDQAKIWGVSKVPGFDTLFFLLQLQFTVSWFLQHVRVIDRDKLRIYPAGTDKSKLRLELHNLKSMLPKVIVKVNKMSIVKFTAIFVCKSISATMMPRLTFSRIKFRAFQLLKELLSTK